MADGDLPTVNESKLFQPDEKNEMLRNWTQQVFHWIQQQSSNARRPRRGSRRFDAARRGAIVEHLESRRLLTNLVAVHVSGGAVTLTDVSDRKVKTGDDFSVTYTGTQFVLTGHNGTMFQVDGKTVSTDTISVTGTLSLSMSLNRHGNTVSVGGDGTANLSQFTVNLGKGREGSSLSMTKVVADSATIDAARRNNSVLMTECTINKDLNATLGRGKGNSLDLEKTTVKGNMTDKTNSLIMNHSTLDGTFTDSQPRRNSTFQSTDTTYTGAADISMGRDGVINMLASADGPNHFKGAMTVTGKSKNHPVTINAPTGTLTNDVKPTLTNATLNGGSTTPATITAPTVTSQVSATGKPSIKGTFDATNGPKLSVAAGGKTYVLGTDSQLTASGNNWTLDLSGTPLTTYSNTITTTSSNNAGDSKTGTGTVTNDQAPIAAFLTAQSLTATKTASGLNIVTTTQGNGAIPTAGQNVTVNYTGRLVNADGTLGTTFDSNTDPQFGHVSPFTFKLGHGEVIAGWDEAFALLKVGTVAKLLIPSSLAYGTSGQGSKIPGNSILEFDVTLVSAS